MYAPDDFTMKEDKTLEQCYICSGTKLDEFLANCIVKGCKSKESWFHPSCLTTQADISEYRLYTYLSKHKGSGNI